MRVSLKELMDKLGVGHIMGGYETHPWSCYDDERELTCSAEVRMGPDQTDVEAEIQLMYDVPPEGKSPMEQVCLIRLKPVAADQWNATDFNLQGKVFEDKEETYNWEEKACNFFYAVVQSLGIDEIPDIERLIRREIHSRERKGNQSGEGGGKSPIVRGGQVMGNKGGGGGF